MQEKKLSGKAFSEKNLTSIFAFLPPRSEKGLDAGSESVHEGLRHIALLHTAMVTNSNTDLLIWKRLTKYSEAAGAGKHHDTISDSLGRRGDWADGRGADQTAVKDRNDWRQRLRSHLRALMC